MGAGAAVALHPSNRRLIRSEGENNPRPLCPSARLAPPACPPPNPTRSTVSHPPAPPLLVAPGRQGLRIPLVAAATPVEPTEDWPSASALFLPAHSPAPLRAATDAPAFSPPRPRTLAAPLSHRPGVALELQNSRHFAPRRPPPISAAPPRLSPVRPRVMPAEASGRPNWQAELRFCCPELRESPRVVTLTGWSLRAPREGKGRHRAGAPGRYFVFSRSFLLGSISACPIAPSPFDGLRPNPHPASTPTPLQPCHWPLQTYFQQTMQSRNLPVCYRAFHLRLAS